MSIHDWDQWCEDNPDWERYYTPDNAPKLGLEMGGFSKLYTKHPGWKDVISTSFKKLNLLNPSNITTNFTRKSKSGIGSTNPVPFGMSNRVMKRKKPINLDYIKKIEPLTENQETFFDSVEDKNPAYGISWYRKDLITLYNALMDVLDTKTPYEKIYIVRSLVPTREIGFLLVIMKTSLISIRFHTRTW